MSSEFVFPLAFSGRLHMLRHGQCRANVKGEFVGRRDLPLTERGWEQARALSRLLEQKISSPPFIVSSPLQRAFDTARTVAAVWDADVSIEDRFIELDYGDLEGTSFASLVSSWPPDWVADPKLSPPNGESNHALTERVLTSLTDHLLCAAAVSVTDLVIVSHLGPVKAVAQTVLQLSSREMGRFFLGEATESMFLVAEGRAVLNSWNLSSWQPGM